MKVNLARTSLGIILFAALASLAPAANARTCSLANVSATYGYTTSGSIPALGPVAGVGRITLDASGNASGAQTVSFFGNIFHETLSGTYTVNPDCTGTLTASVFRSGVLVRTSTLDLVWVNNRTEVRAIFLTAGTAITVDVKRIFTDEED